MQRWFVVVLVASNGILGCARHRGPVPPAPAASQPAATRAGPQPPSTAPDLVLAADPRVAIMGRVVRMPGGAIRFGYPGVRLRVVMVGGEIAVRAQCSTGDCRFAVTVDGGEPQIVRVAAGASDLRLASGLGAGEHLIDLAHRTETWQGIATVTGFVLPAGATLAPPPPWPERRLLFIGDSVTCGEGVDRASAVPGVKAASADGTRSYGMLVARTLDAQCHLVCFGGRGLIRDWQGRRDVKNLPELFELALADDPEPVKWNHEEYSPDVIVVSLGTNDFNLGLGPFPGEEEFVGAYVAFVRTLRSRHPDAKVLLTEGAIVNDTADPEWPQKTVLGRYLAETVRRLGDANVAFVVSQHYPGDATDAHPTGEHHLAMARDLAGPIAALAGWPAP
ncbi:MAG: hypothetical protein JW751_30390 [Polyangiaceae bacterium]|nr:hypothetical protein [Polyangiaceae bacterium]